MAGRQIMPLWLNILIHLVLLSSCYDCTSQNPTNPDATTSASTAITSGQDHSFSHKHDVLEVNELRKKHSGTVVARKGVSLSDEETSSSSDLCSNSSSKNHASTSCAAQSPEGKTDLLELNAKNTSPIVNETKSLRNTSSAVGVTSIAANTSTTAKPVMKPLYTSDDYSIADYDENKNSYSSSANSFLTTFSLSVIIVSLIILTLVLFFKLKYKFSVQQNYRRVDYLIDGMYL